jgi:hypothetical protein
MAGFSRRSAARVAMLAVGLVLISGVALISRVGPPGAANAAETATPATAANAPKAHCPKSRVTYSKAGGETTQFGWLLAPGANGTVPRGALEYNVVGGQVICDSVALNNPSKHAVTVRLYSADAYNIADGGGFAFTAFKDKVTGVGTWIKLPVTSVTVPAGRKAEIPIVVRVPTNVTPGDAAGGVVARDTKVRRGESVAGVGVGVRAGVGVRLYAQVAGLLHPKLSLTKLNLQLKGGLGSRLLGAGSATVSYEVGNAGNVRLSPQSSGKVTTRWKTFKLGTHQFAELLPGTRPIVVKEKVTGLRWGSLTGRVRATVTVTAAGAKPVISEVTMWQVPWLSLVAASCLLLVTAGFWVVRRRHRNRVSASNLAAEEAVTEAPDPVAR